jgi:PTS system fructose-specific IIA component/PTS system nitrogen regulatory IIA component
MPMTDFVVREAIVPALAATTKEAVIREIVDSLRATGYVGADVADDVVRAILKREQLGSTGIGRGIAIPHTKHASADRLTGTVALSPGGVAFDSIDGEPVYVFVLLVSPQDRPGDHLRALENVVRSMRDEGFVQALRQAQTKDEVWRLLDESAGPWHS